MQVDTCDVTQPGGRRRDIWRRLTVCPSAFCGTFLSSCMLRVANVYTTVTTLPVRHHDPRDATARRVMRRDVRRGPYELILYSLMYNSEL